MRDLGVTHDSKLLLDKYVDCIVKKASKALGFLMRSSVNFRGINTLKILYCTSVHSILEYASQIWNPYYNILIIYYIYYKN